MEKPVANILVVQMVVAVMVVKQESVVLVAARMDVVATQKTVVHRDKLIFDILSCLPISHYFTTFFIEISFSLFY